MTRYTVIGSGGFVGSRVVTRLESAGLTPWCPQRDEPALFTSDLGRVIYCAGLTGDYRTRPFATVEAHVSLLARIIERASFERIVYLSSTRLYDLLPDGIGTEDRAIPVNPADAEHLYELSKMLGENLTLHRTRGRGMVARLSYVFGGEDGAQGFLSDWLRCARETRSIDLDSSPDLARDYVYVDDVAAALIVMADGEDSAIVNVATGQAISNEQIAALFRRRGWTVRFARGSAEPERALAIDSTRLHDLGITPRAVLPLIDEYLGNLPSPSPLT